MEASGEQVKLRALNNDTSSIKEKPRTRGLNPVRYAEMLREYLKDHQKIRNAELRELLGLGDSDSAQVEASRYLKKWSQPDGFLEKGGGGSNVFYTLRKAA